MSPENYDWHPNLIIAFQLLDYIFTPSSVGIGPVICVV